MAVTVFMNTYGKVGQSLLPGQHGARRWTAQYGTQLVQVRYRYDPVSGLRHTTVELVVETSPWSPPLPATALVKVGFEEEALRQRLRAAGSIWEPALRRWRVPLPLVRELQLENRLDTPSPHS